MEETRPLGIHIPGQPPGSSGLESRIPLSARDPGQGYYLTFICPQFHRQIYILPTSHQELLVLQCKGIRGTARDRFMGRVMLRDRWLCFVIVVRWAQEGMLGVVVYKRPALDRGAPWSIAPSSTLQPPRYS